ncbi:MAG: sigma-70 family RNA polymerase sigma factor [Opitutales bacterium]|nr:sigma-70 family RNA polymerase sigma factor [Opitutales bacterium]
MTESIDTCPDDAGQEAEWIRRSVEGDKDAFRMLHQRYHPRVFRLILGMLRHEENAREVSQQVWIKVWRKLDTFQGKSAFSTWVYRIANYAALDFLRANRKYNKVDSIDAGKDNEEDGIKPIQLASESLEDQPLSVVRKKEIMERFHQALNGLNEQHRSALVLREVEGLSYEEIAKVMECKIGTVMSRIFNARKAIQQQMEEFR